MTPAVATAAPLHRYLIEAARRWPEQTAVVEPGAGSISYARLDHLSDRVRDRLHAMGVRRGDRVGLYLRKSIDTVAAIYGVLKAGAAYVPVDPGAPASRDDLLVRQRLVRKVDRPGRNACGEGQRFGGADPVVERDPLPGEVLERSP